MKKTLLLLAVIIISNTGMAQWQQTGGSASYFRVGCFGACGSNLYAGAAGGLLLSTNNGSNWSLVENLNPGFGEFYSFGNNGNNFYADHSFGIYYTNNNGTNWVTINTTLPSSLARTMTVSGNNIFAGTIDAGVFLSTDNGGNWVAKNNGLNSNLITIISIIGSNIYLSCGYKVYLSTNNGDNWLLTNTGLPTGSNDKVNSFAFIDDKVFASTIYTGVFLSTNNGGNWSAVNNGLDTLFCNSIISYGYNLFVGTEGGVFLSTNNGNNWSDVSNGLTNMRIKSLFISSNYIFAGTEGDGLIFRRPLSEIIGINEIENKISISLYPNPATDYITINLQDIRNLSNSILSVYNIQGQMLLQQNINDQQTKINISQLPQGIYFAKIRLGDGSVAEKKFVVVR